MKFDSLLEVQGEYLAQDFLTQEEQDALTQTIANEIELENEAFAIENQ
ncbi:hypothetical protein [Vibrio anguillarum]|nr:hypothetical protein [Vibrio anguillarum]